jgi:hypothetical protein
MERNSRTLFGSLLIIAGVLLLLQRLNFIGGQWNDAVFAVLYGLGVIYFAQMYRADRSRWWPGLLAFILAGVTIGNLLEIFLPGQADNYAGSVVLFMIGLGFLLIYLSNRINWWANIPSGVMFSLTAVTLLEELSPRIGFEAAGLLFIGLGLTFLSLYFLRVEGQQLSWAVFPAIPLIIFGLFVSFEQREAWNFIWPAVIILFGVYFLVGSLRRGENA